MTRVEARGLKLYPLHATCFCSIRPLRIDGRWVKPLKKPKEVEYGFSLLLAAHIPYEKKPELLFRQPTMESAYSQLQFAHCSIV